MPKYKSRSNASAVDDNVGNDGNNTGQAESGGSIRPAGGISSAGAISDIVTTIPSKAKTTFDDVKTEAKKALSKAAKVTKPKPKKVDKKAVNIPVKAVPKPMPVPINKPMPMPVPEKPKMIPTSQKSEAIQKYPLITGGSLDLISPISLPHIIQNATPFEFSMLRGLASDALDIPHPMRNFIKKQAGGSLFYSKRMIPNAIKDILRAPSGHVLSEMLHKEHNLFSARPRSKTGGGLFETVKGLLRTGIEGSRNYSGQAVSLADSLSKWIDRGLAMANMIEPFVERAPEEMQIPLKAILHGARTVGNGVNIGNRAVKSVHGLLHGEGMDSFLKMLGDQGKPATPGFDETESKYVTQGDDGEFGYRDMSPETLRLLQMNEPAMNPEV